MYKIDSHKYLLYSTENYTQCFVIAFKGKEDEKKSLHMIESLCYTPKTNIAF